MALTFAKAAQKSTTSLSTSKPASSPSNSTKQTPKSQSGVSFLKSGSAAQEALATEEAKAEMAKAEAGRAWRFMLKDGEEKRVTFLDGNLDENGMLTDQRFYQHTLFVNGNWMNFVCTSDVDQSQPCPICARNDKDSRPSLVGVLTVIDHSEHVVQSGPNKGNVIKNQRRLYVMKKGTIKHLQKLAEKRGGLAGCTFDIARTGEKEPNVGNQFDFVEKHESLASIAAELGLKEEDCLPLSYGEEIKYYTPQELIELGVGKAHGGPGYEKGVGSKIADQL
ncbi:MAG: hypothetical protein M9945_14320 [Aquamicrobium sp.]|uniref:hypothetical protein n=1 Tax=Aquamicrobium sp. TaxID=1872579 RepID=UPI00349EB898|nr:hypothetical protein [Aquamicrobium sp.]